MKLVDILGYLVINYPKPNDLSKGRLNKLVYLCDWKSSIDNYETISNIEWKFNHYGPYVDDIISEINKDDRFQIKVEINQYGNEKHLIILKNTKGFTSPNEKEKKILDKIIDITFNLNWTDFINAVYSTYPITNSERGTYLNLVELAKNYNKSKEE